MARRWLPLVGLALLLGAPRARAGYRDSFKRGMDAFDRRQWEEVVRHMRAAVAENASEGERIKLYGLRFEVYYPHFYSGYAFVQLGQCSEAVKSLQTSQAQGAIRSSPRYAELIDGLKSCEATVATVKPPSPPPPTAPTRSGPDPAALAEAGRAADAALFAADEAARMLAPLASDTLLAPVWTREPALGAAEAEAKAALAGARGRLEAGRRASDLTLLAEARDQAARAREQLDGVRRAAERRRDDLRRGQAQRTTPSPPPSPAPSPGQALAPKAALMAGAQAYFDGRYDDALGALEAIGAGALRGRSAAQAALLRAATRFALYRAGGEKNAELRRRAAQDVAACRRADPALLPDPSAFSPSFGAFFRSPSE